MIWRSSASRSSGLLSTLHTHRRLAASPSSRMVWWARTSVHIAVRTAWPCSNKRRVNDRTRVVQAQYFLLIPQIDNGVLDRRFTHHGQGLEPTGQSRVFLYVFTVFNQGPVAPTQVANSPAQGRFDQSWAAPLQHQPYVQRPSVDLVDNKILARGFRSLRSGRLSTSSRTHTIFRAAINAPMFQRQQAVLVCAAIQGVHQ